MRKGREWVDVVFCLIDGWYESGVDFKLLSSPGTARHVTRERLGLLAELTNHRTDWALR